ncbi:uncharacterized protein LOC134279864 isoform X1 [Saccostrea cucullata]|uniref:uncharacterized protein LOC134279864 isoform X1 n=1 Tax=Saccostrea cuccullata TaxID=36930 RepID=UPI002ED00420
MEELKKTTWQFLTGGRLLQMQSLQHGSTPTKQMMDFYTRELWKYLDFAIGTEEDVKLRREINGVYVEVMNVSQISDQFISGSAAEGFKFHWSDLDIMWSLTKETVVMELEGLTNFKHIKFIASDIGCKPSFCKLVPYPFVSLMKRFVKVCDAECVSRIKFFEDCHKYSYNKCTDSTSHGPCVTSYISREYDVCFCFPIHPISSHKILRNFSTTFWNDLKLRLLEKSVTVMHVVPKGPTNGDVKGIQWLKSFCALEQHIIHSLNHVQFCCYGLLKIVIHDKIEEHSEMYDTLSSYHLKTVLFHVLEDIHSDFWIPRNILYCFWICFTRLILFVSKGVCPNYFFPECNLFLQGTTLTKKSKIEEILLDVMKSKPYYLVSVTRISSLNNPARMIQQNPKKLRDLMTFSMALMNVKGYQGTFQKCMLSIVKIFQFLENEKDERIIASLKYLFISFMKRAGVILYEKFVLTGFTQYLLSAEAAFILERNFLASAGLFLATLWYCQGKYNSAIEVLCHVLDKLPDSILMFVIYNSFLLCDIDKPRCNISHLLEKYCSWNISFPRNSCCYPEDLKSDVHACPMNDFVMYDKSYALFLMFLCHLEMGHSRNCKNTLRKLYDSYKDIRFCLLYSQARENSEKLATIAKRKLKNKTRQNTKKQCKTKKK